LRRNSSRWCIDGAISRVAAVAMHSSVTNSRTGRTTTACESRR
jgi:hypothetical protein